MPEPVGRAMGIDFGTKRIGVAITDSNRTLATPLEVIDGSERASAVGRIASLVEEWEISVLVVGLPLHLSGAAGESVRKVQHQIEALGATIDIPIVTYDERLTTVSAHRSLDDQKVSARNRRDVVDMIAATVILQGWIDSTGGSPPSTTNSDS